MTDNAPDLEIRLAGLLAPAADCIRLCGLAKPAGTDREACASLRTASLAELAAAAIPDVCAFAPDGTASRLVSTAARAPSDPDAAMRTFLARRRALVEPERGPAPESADVLRELARPGALLLLDHESDLFDGAAEPMSAGFLDWNYNPPWDTWLSLVPAPGATGGRHLLSWVPAWALALVEGGIAVDPAPCLAWCRVKDGIARPLGWGERLP